MKNVPNPRKVSYLTSRLKGLSSKTLVRRETQPIPPERWTKTDRSATIALVFCGVVQSS